MSPDPDYIETANRILQEQGYLVCGFGPGDFAPPPIGYVIPHSIQGIPGPFVIVGHATLADYMEQARKYSSDAWFAESKTRASRAIAFFKLAAE